jgi:AraC-like DNA-binding protein
MTARKDPARADTSEIRQFLDDLEPGAHIAQLVSCLPDTNYFAKDHTGRFVLFDEGFIAMLGCQRADQILGRTDFDFFPREVAMKYVTDDRTVMTTGQPLRDLIEPVPDSDLTFTWWVVNKVPLRDRAGNVVGVAGLTSKLSPQNAPALHGEGMLRVLQVIGTRFRERMSVAELARQAGLSVRSLERNFMRLFHTTPLRYINRVRLHAARFALVHTSKNLAAIAGECGFYDQSHMTRQFSLSFRMSPSRYRARFSGVESRGRKGRVAVTAVSDLSKI